MRMNARMLKLLAAVGAALLLPAQALAGEPLLPDLKPERPLDLQIQIDARGHHLLRFTQGLANMGPGILMLHGVLNEDGTTGGYQDIIDDGGRWVESLPLPSMQYDPASGDWQIGGLISYAIRAGSPGGQVVTGADKAASCLIDHARAEGYSGLDYTPWFTRCDGTEFGITQGWASVAKDGAPGQYIDVTDAPRDGAYFLVVTANPKGTFQESRPANNTAWVKLEIYENVRRVREIAPDEIVIRVNGARQSFPVRARLVEGRAMAHVRLAEQLGAAVEWDGSSVIITRGEKQIRIMQGLATAVVNGEAVAMGGAAAFMEEGRVLVPVRFLAEQLGAAVEWDGVSSTVNLTR